MGLSTPADICRRYLESFATGDPDVVASFVSNDFVNEHTSALGSGCQGKDEYRRRLPGFIASMPGLSYEVESQIAEGDQVANAYTLRARVNERDIAVRGMMRITVRDGLITDRTDYWDSKSFLQQAGLEA
ncbi:MAG: nuclear transport factor 2 family protein [Actinobacteria bacterium]|nr:nuclear transport factor 2 family protein [Actinomycetota bacterium]